MKNQHYSDTKKINPGSKPDGTIDDNNRIEIGPTALAFSEWEHAGILAPSVATMRRYRLDRLVNEINKRDYAGVLLFDPLNIRYATDSTNMQLWNTHNPFRAAMVLANGYMVVWDYKNSPFLCEHNPAVNEVRSDASMYYFGTGDKTQEAASRFADQVNDLLQEHASSNRRLAVDKIMLSGYHALNKLGMDIVEGEELMERTRAVKGPDEILAMRCSLHACEKSVAVMHAIAEPGLSEDAIWAVLHSENIKRGGEWIETRLLTSGPRTSPWFQECGPRILQNNEILAFDTDLIGVYGICSDISRTWFIGDGKPSKQMIEDYQIARDHIHENMQLLAPGIAFKDLVFNGHKLGKHYQKQKYGCSYHGVGLCDEWPLITYPDQYIEGAFEGKLEPGNVLCVEALISHENRDFSIKLEEQVLITENGFECLSQYPFDDRLMGV